jgi:hypothetical protein
MMPKPTQKTGFSIQAATGTSGRKKILPKSHAIKEGDMRRVVKSVRWAWLGR